MELRRVVEALRRRWWLILGLPLVVAVGGLVRMRDAPSVATLRATVLIPGDTETPGTAERPELMVLDDAPVLASSRAFADAIVAHLRATASPVKLNTDQVHAALSADRYSRILTIRATRSDPREALTIAAAAAAILPDFANQYLVAAGTKPATVKIIDPPQATVSGRPHAHLILAVQVLVALAAGVGLAALVAALDQRLYAADDVAAALGLPVLADLRSGRRRWPRTALAPRTPTLHDAASVGREADAR